MTDEDAGPRSEVSHSRSGLEWSSNVGSKACVSPTSGTPSSRDAITSLYHGVKLTEDFGMYFQFHKMKCTVARRTVIID